MAKTNKYSSINFNDIYEKKTNHLITSNTRNNNPSSSSSKSHLSRSGSHGGMLVLTRPSPKPLPSLQPPKPSSPPSLVNQTSQSEPETNPPSISLRPLGRSPSAIIPSREPPTLQPQPQPQPQPQQSILFSKPEPFVPPHLRPGFVGRQEKFGQQKNHNHQGTHRNREFGSPNRVGDDGPPKSGGGHDRMRRRGGGELDHGEMNRPGSSGRRYGSSSSSN